MSDPDSPRDTWFQLLLDLQTALSHCSAAGAGGSDDTKELTPIANERRFHKAFLGLCYDLREPDPQRLIAKFQKQHDKILRFIEAIDESYRLTPPTCLNTLLWTTALETVKSALERGQKGVIFNNNLPELNESLPSLDCSPLLFPGDAKVQHPLQNIFSTYMNCYFAMLVQFTSNTSPPSFEVVDNQIEEARLLFEANKTEWEKMVKKAHEEQNARLATSIPSFPRGTRGPQSPYTPGSIFFEWIESLGHGAYAQVSKVREKTSGRIYAQKLTRVYEASHRDHMRRVVENEVSVMEKLSHHHIASVLFPIFDHDAFTLIMLPVADYNLLQFLQNMQRAKVRDGFPRSDLTHLTSWFGCLMSAVAFAHSKRIKHEDIKPSNILIKDHQLYLADFGSAQDFSQLEHSNSFNDLGFGTPVYLAPENPPRGRAADIFALGCVFSEMLTVRQNRTLEDYQAARYTGNTDNPYAYRKNLPKVHDWVGTLGNQSKHDPVAELLVEVTLKMLQENSNTRPEARDVKRALRPENEAVFCSICY